GFGLNCHQCTTLGTSDCLDDGKPKDMSGECEGENKCVKYKTAAIMHDSGSVWSDNTEVSAVTRGCLETDEKDGCVRKIIHGGYHVTCICSGDDCNAAPIHSLAYVALSVSVILTCLLHLLI
ncbi:uncharacterized protein LOC115214309, partial [Argonauta hians]